MTKHFDPLDYDNLGASIARALGERPVQSLIGLPAFDGAGIYALYYTGDHPAYADLSAANLAASGSWAIYIGKAGAENARKGDPDQANKPVGKKLHGRIGKHRKSIEAVNNLDESDFQIRALTVAPTWIPLAEVVAIRMHNPVWNVIVDGLGNHDPGSGRYEVLRPRWDTLHPGRAWAPKLTTRSEAAADIQQDVVQYLRTHRP